jgi:hypothetical protein
MTAVKSQNHRFLSKTCIMSMTYQYWYWPWLPDWGFSDTVKLFPLKHTHLVHCALWKEVAMHSIDFRSGKIGTIFCGWSMYTNYLEFHMEICLFFTIYLFNNLCDHYILSSMTILVLLGWFFFSLLCFQIVPVLTIRSSFRFLCSFDTPHDCCWYELCP